MTKEEILKQIGEALSSYPDRNPDKACADCAVFPPFEAFQFSCYDNGAGGTGKWELATAREDYTGWVTFSVIGPGPFNRKICPACAKKRTMI
jgi:hypothetical protein